MDGHRFDTIYKQITELKKEANKHKQQKKEMADIIEQDILQEIKDRWLHKMPEVFLHPALDSKRLPSEVETYKFLYQFIYLFILLHFYHSCPSPLPSAISTSLHMYVLK